MRVAVDATAIPAQLGGVGRYVAELLPALVRLGVDVVAVVRPGEAAWLLGADTAVEVVEGPGLIERRPVRLAWEQSGLPRLVGRLKADVHWGPHYTMPVMAPRNVARVVTLHDATFFSSPEVHSPVKRVVFRQATRYAVRQADALVVPSAATRDAVLRTVAGDAARFHVAHHGVDPAAFHPVSDDERRRVADALGLAGRRYVAFLGTLEPRKNLSALVRGWGAAVRNLADPPALVLAGGQGWDAALDDEIARVDPRLTVLRPGYLPLGDLAGFLGGAEVVAYPSLGEGFGLPVLEAMACGAVVLTSRMLSLPEVGGDAVAYCGTRDEDVAAALSALLTDGDRSADLRLRAVRRAARFTWDASARAHLKAFEAALARRRELGSRVG